MSTDSFLRPAASYSFSYNEIGYPTWNKTGSWKSMLEEPVNKVDLKKIQ